MYPTIILPGRLQCPVSPTNKPNCAVSVVVVQDRERCCIQQRSELTPVQNIAAHVCIERYAFSYLLTISAPTSSSSWNPTQLVRQHQRLSHFKPTTHSKLNSLSSNIIHSQTPRSFSPHTTACSFSAPLSGV